MDLGDHDDRRPRGLAVSPMAKKTRSLSDGGGTASTTAASNSTPAAVGGGATTSKDDSDSSLQQQPTTPHRPLSSSLSSGLFFLPALPPQRKTTPPPAAAPASASGTLPTTATATAAAAFARPLSPHLDRSSTYASGVNVLPRRSRGLDFSRAATSLHHSTLAESSPESSPGRTAGAGTGAGAINIPGRRRGPPFETTAAENTSTSLWSMMGDQERINLSHSLGSNNGGMHGGGGGSDSSSSSDDDDLMDDDDDAAMDEPYVTTPHVSRTAPSGAFGSPATGGLASFQQRQRHHRRNQGKHHYKARVPFGAGSSAAAAAAASSSSAAFARTGSPPLGARRDSISWQANQLHISGMDGDDVDGLGDGHPTVVRRAVTRRGNLLVR